MSSVSKDIEMIEIIINENENNRVVPVINTNNNYKFLDNRNEAFRLVIAVFIFLIFAFLLTIPSIIYLHNKNNSTLIVA